MHSRQLRGALEDFVHDAAVCLTRDTAAGSEVPFEVVAQPSRGKRAPLYCYRPLTAQFISQRADELSHLPSYPCASHLLAGVAGLDRYLLARGVTHIPAGARDCANAALRSLLDDVFADQTDFELREDRLADAVTRLEDAVIAGPDHAVLVATVHGVALGCSELALTHGLTLATPAAMEGAPPDALVGSPTGPTHLLAMVTVEGADAEDPLRAARATLRDLLRALRLYGDGRVRLGAMAWWRVSEGAWRTVALGGWGGRARGMLVVTPDQEDELRAFFNLLSRRPAQDGEIAWALGRYEMGCQRDSDHEALSDYLLALRALLEPEGASTGLLPGRLAVLCATPDRRAAMAERVARATDLERAIITGAALAPGGSDALVAAIGDHLRALLRDVLCGHLSPDLHLVADGLLAACDDAEGDEPSADDELTQRLTQRARHAFSR